MGGNEKLKPEKVRRYANLSKIELSPAEEESLSNELSMVLDYFRLLRELDTSGVDPTLSLAVEGNDDLREDKPVKCNPEDILALAPSRKGRFVKSPGIL